MKEYSFKSMDELKKFLEERKDEERELFYYGDLDTLDGNLYTIKDIEKDMDPSWFEDGGVSTVYEFEEGEIEEEEEVKTREGYEVTAWDSRDNVYHYGIFDTEKEAVYRAEGVLDEMKREHRECTVYVDKGIFEWNEDRKRWDGDSDKYDYEQILVLYTSTEEEEEEDEE